jgi:hypothetical protein
MSGSQIGGVVGAIAGGLITWSWQGIQAGYAIGSAVGGYVDPTKTSGPRLTDAQNQTSTVGGVIPFGYGTYTCAGNIIWTDRLIEHKKTERVGKGGSQKNTTYTYTRSYAIGVSETISAYVWIKKNGKLVYAANPTSLGAAMGWTSKEISDLVASSNKFLQMATLYYGTASQMPDSTIVAVEGVGNVSPFRDLAYIVLENEDLTDMQGAVSQYEFCVSRGAAKSYTTPPYAIYVVDAAGIVVTPTSGVLRTILQEADADADAVTIAVAPIGGTLRDNKVQVQGQPDEITLGVVPTGGVLRQPLKSSTADPSSIQLAVAPTNGLLKLTLISSTQQPSYVTVGVTPTGGTLS